MRTFRLLLCSGLLLVAAFSALGEEKANIPGLPVEKVIDRHIHTALKDAGVQPAPRADDATLIRRLTLDLVGRIPTVTETQEFVASTDPDKVQKLVDRLIASPGYIRHQTTEFNLLLMSDTRGSVKEYLQTAFTENRPWDQMFRELMLPNETDPKLKSAGEFLRQRITDLDKATSEVSSVFFGVDISCARCHDHPKVEDWKQDHFFGMKAFLSRTFDNGGFLGEREYGKVKFKTVKGQEKVAGFLFLSNKPVEGGIIDDPAADVMKKEKESLETLKKNKQPPPAAKNSARAKLVEIALQPGQGDFLARNIVNRLWARFYGRGLVEPIDQLHSENEPSHPELLHWLAGDLIAHKYDLRRLIRGMVLSEAYARSSRWEKGDAPLPNLFAVARVRPLRPHQLATSLRLATNDPAVFAPQAQRADLEKKLEAIESSAGGFASLIEQPGEDFQISVTEALLFSNGDRVHKEFLVDAPDRLIGRLKTIEDARTLIETATQAVLCRAPSADEVQAMTAYLAKRQDRKAEACKQIVWALITSSEFRFNY